MGFDIGSLIGGNIIDGVGKIISLFKVPPEKQLEAQTELAKIQLELQGKILDQVQGQLDINKVEAASTSVWVAGWRPAIGWICGFALASQFIIGPLLTWGSTLIGHPTSWPVANTGDMMTVLLGMLGLGGMRTYEKVNNVPGTKGLH